jgi:hypothetical protein
MKLPRCALTTPLALLSVAALAACGGGGGVAVGRSSAPKAPNSASAGGAEGAASNTAYTIELPVRLRVVNLFTLSGAEQQVDVWAGTPVSGKKLATVDYGTVSEVLTPLASSSSQPQSKGGQDSYQYTITLYKAGLTDPLAEIAQQGEGSFPGDEITMVAAPSGISPQSFKPAAGNLRVLFTASNPASGNGSMYDKTQAAADQSLLYVDASGEIPGTGSARAPGSQLPDGSTYDLGQPGKGCLGEVGPSAPAPGDTHSRALFSRSSGGGFFYVLDPGQHQVAPYALSSTPSKSGCTGTPAAGPFDVAAAAGGRQGLFLFGQPSALKALMVAL